MSTSGDAGYLKLLCLDGGGVRGLSALYILKRLMETKSISSDPHHPVKPCDYFDMIGGTSTGGLIAIMLGRLEMTVDECIEAYGSAMGGVFRKTSRGISLKGKVQGRFDTRELEKKIKEFIKSKGCEDQTLYTEDGSTKCKVFVCAGAVETTSATTFTSYISQDGYTSLLQNTKIWEAARATTAARSFFDPIKIGQDGRRFEDAALYQVNNPIREMMEEAQYVWSQGGEIHRQIQCLVSIGTGNPGVAEAGDGLFEVMKTLKAIATETEKTAREFKKQWKAQLVDTKKYYRFNVVHGLENVGIEAHDKRSNISACTYKYLKEDAVDALQDFEAVAGELLIEERSPFADPSESSPAKSMMPGEPAQKPQKQSAVTHSPGRMLFYNLSNSPDQINRDEEHPWRKLTLPSWRMYERIWAQMPKCQQGRAVSLQGFNDLLPKESHKTAAARYWSFVLPSETSAQEALVTPLSKSLAMAVLFILHLHMKADWKPVRPTNKRRFLLRRFASWVDCQCGCGRRWNFVNDIGLLDERELVVSGGGGGEGDGRRKGRAACEAKRFRDARPQGMIGAWWYRKGMQIDVANRNAWRAAREY